MANVLPGNLTVVPGNRIVLPGNRIVLLGNREHFSKESLHTGARARAHARARAGTTGNRAPKSYQNHTCTATDGVKNL